MLFTSWLSCVLLAVAVSADAGSKEVPEKLVAETTHRPESCPHTAQHGDSIQVHYTGTLHANGNKFDSSHDRGQPLPLTLGVGQVIKGWDDGLVGMCVGEKRTLTIPPDQAYGSRGFGNIIPANSALVFHVELMHLEKKGGHNEL